MESRNYDRALVPMAPIAACLTAGILSGILLKPEAWLLTSIMGGWLISFISFFCFRKAPVAKYFAWSFLTVTGILLCAFSDERLHPDHLVHQKIPVTAYVAEVLALPDETKSGFRTQIMIKSVQTPQGWLDRHSRCLIYTRQNNLLMPGNAILVSGAPQALRKPLNATDNSYVEYLQRRNIYFRHKPTTPLIMVEKPGSTVNKIRRQIAGFQLSCIRILDNRIHNRAIAGVMHALILGVTDHIDPEVNQAFAETGTLHVLAVSGMHISLIYSMLLMVLYPATRVAKLRWWVAGVCILLLWTYAALTSFSPSVLRAVTMFSLAAIAKPQGKSVNIWNIYSAAVFLMLLTDPMAITSIGFLLSFLAVAGIIWLQPAFENLISTKNWITRWLWSTTCVSVSAQLLTIPVTMAVFGTFPVYFLPANILIIPLSNVALASGLVMVLTDFFSPIAKLAAVISTISIEWMNAIATFVKHLPFHQLSMQPIPVTAAVLLAGMMLSALAYLLHRNRSAPNFFLIFSIAWAATGLLQRAEDQTRFELTIYHSPGNPTLSIATKEKTFVVTQDRNKVPNEITRYFQHSDTQWVELPAHSSADIDFGGHRLTYQALIKADSNYKKTDWLIIASGKAINRLSETVIVDCRRRYEINKNPIHYAFITANQGAYRVEGALFGTWKAVD